MTNTLITQRDARAPWWHRHDDVEHVDTHGMKMAEALDSAGLAFTAELRPLATWNKLTQTFDAHDGRWGICRDDNDQMLGTVKDRYKPIQYADALAFVDQITAGWDANIDKIWARPDGSRMHAAVAYKHDVGIAGMDTVRPYLIFTAGHDGLTSVRMTVNAFQMSCLNQLPNIRNGATVDMQIVHSAKADMHIQQAAEAIISADQHMERLTAEMALLTTQQLSHVECERIVTYSANRHIKSDKAKHDDTVGIVRLLTESPTMPAGFAGTKMGLLHAVTEYYDHFRPYRNAAVIRREHQQGRARRMCETVLATLSS